MKIDELSIADLKAAYDFVLIDLKNLKTAAIKKGISADSIPAYKEVKSIEDRLYTRLLNTTRDLK